MFLVKYHALNSFSPLKPNIDLNNAYKRIPFLRE
jgi:hypothetical protein